MKQIIDYVKSSGGIEYAQEKMLQYRSEALEMLDQFPDNESKESLKQLVYFVTDRKK